ncbi:MAG: hypothetical protein BGO09_14265 [Bacteroidetes bacterium 47-18]|nr:MAG: hypothetical protein BGO09_14265 [Bacteroidetes bacterium 47-18]
MTFRKQRFFVINIFIFLICGMHAGLAQTTATPGMDGGGNSPLNRMPGMNFGRGGVGGDIQTDSLGNIQSDWDDTPADIYYTSLYSNTRKNIDTSLTFFHRNSKLDRWGRNLGNEGLAAYDMIFNPVQQVGLSSGYHAYDLYKLVADSLRFYNTTRPYSDFSYMMGPRRQQFIKLLHTQNITPDWNIAGEVINLNSPGVFQLQTARNIVAHLSSNYISDNKRYQMKAAMVYHRFRQDENGGIMYDSLLEDPLYNFRSLIGVNFPGRNLSTATSAVSNTHKEIQLLLRHQYALVGVSDTSYNEDSTAMTVSFTPRFTIHHTFDLRRQQNIFNDADPEDQRYYDFNKTIYGFSTADSVYGNQQWLVLENRFGISGTLGKSDNNVSLEAGIGNRLDRFAQSVSAERSGTEAVSFISNYLYGTLTREAQELKRWFYGARAELYFTGPAAGNFLVEGNLGRVIKDIALLQAGFTQSLTAAPYYQQHYKTNFYTRDFDLNAYSVTNIRGNIIIPKLKAQAGIRNLLITNYIYLDSNFRWQQQAEPFNVLQVSAQKHFKWGIFHSENEGIYQQATGNAPVNLPQLMLRHQLRIETPMFKRNLHFTFGVEGRYHTNYSGDGYLPYLNQFYLQHAYTIRNKPELMVFFNFKVRAFRAFVVFDQVQQLFWTNAIYAKGYPAPNTIFRFGFSWVLYN